MEKATVTLNVAGAMTAPRTFDAAGEYHRPLADETSVSAADPDGTPPGSELAFA